MREVPGRAARARKAQAGVGGAAQRLVGAGGSSEEEERRGTGALGEPEPAEIDPLGGDGCRRRREDDRGLEMIRTGAVAVGDGGQTIMVWRGDGEKKIAVWE